MDISKSSEIIERLFYLQSITKLNVEAKNVPGHCLLSSFTFLTFPNLRINTDDMQPAYLALQPWLSWPLNHIRRPHNKIWQRWST